MSAVAVFFLALAMSTDAFAAAVGKGTALEKPQWREALRTGAIFGSIEAVTPIIGWVLGHAASDYVRAWDHWIAFALLTVLGSRMLLTAFVQRGTPNTKPHRHSFWVLAMTGFATSIDAMAVGVGLAFINVGIVPIALAIGLATCVMVTIGRDGRPRAGSHRRPLGGSPRRHRADRHRLLDADRARGRGLTPPPAT